MFLTVFFIRRFKLRSEKELGFFFFFFPYTLNLLFRKKKWRKMDCTVVFIRVLFCLFYFIGLSFGVSLSKIFKKLKALSLLF